MRLLTYVLVFSSLTSGTGRAAAGQNPGSPTDDDYRAMAAISFRAWPRTSIHYQVTVSSPTGDSCLDMDVTREGTRNQASASRPNSPCESYTGLQPIRDGGFDRYMRSVGVMVLTLPLEATVVEGEGRTIAGVETRCFFLSEPEQRADLCFSPASGALLYVNAERAGNRLVMTATSVYSATEPDNPEPGDLPALMALLRRGMAATHTTDFELGGGGRLVAARSGGRDRLAFEGGPDAPGTYIDIDDGQRVLVCRDLPDDTPPQCTERSRLRIGPPEWQSPLRLSGLERQILADPGARSVETAARRIADRDARCHTITVYPPPTGLPVGVGSTVRREETVCLDAEQGTLLLRQVGSEPPMLVATRHVPTAGAALFQPPYPPG